ncbi:hypothetical protein [Kitasatospora terrestris]|uniref:NlpC/P60 domain-containing protein n=1 Tax=Kitasatospora terrestris TaxID=258051 RepID=A0ABP9D7G7_9ACTN
MPSSRIAKLTRTALATAIAASGIIAGTAFTTGSAHAASSVGGTISRDEVLTRANDWYNRQVPYDQQAWTTDLGGKNYRQDCSGFVSMAWHLNNSETTDTLDVRSLTTRIALTDLQPGDALDNDPHDGNSPYGSHIVLFDHWIDKSSGQFAFISEANSNDDMTKGTGTIGGYGNAGYFGLRYNNIIDAAWLAGDYPVAGNWDGGPADNVGIWRPSTGQFHLRNDDGGITKVDWGQAGDIPVSGNWDGGPANVGIWRPSTGEFHLRMDDGSLTKISWGQAGDIPVSGNWDGGPAENIGIWRPSTGEFHLRNDDGSLTKISWGQNGDIPVSANWDGGNGTNNGNIGIWRPSTAQFQLRNDDGSNTRLDWGQPR